MGCATSVSHCTTPASALPARHRHLGVGVTASPTLTAAPWITASVTGFVQRKVSFPFDLLLVDLYVLTGMTAVSSIYFDVDGNCLLGAELLQ